MRTSCRRTNTMCPRLLGSVPLGSSLSGGVLQDRLFLHGVHPLGGSYRNRTARLRLLRLISLLCYSKQVTPLEGIGRGITQVMNERFQKSAQKPPEASCATMLNSIVVVKDRYLVVLASFNPSVVGSAFLVPVTYNTYMKTMVLRLVIVLL